MLELFIWVRERLFPLTFLVRMALFMKQPSGRTVVTEEQQNLEVDPRQKASHWSLLWSNQGKLPISTPPAMMAICRKNLLGLECELAGLFFLTKADVCGKRILIYCLLIRVSHMQAYIPGQLLRINAPLKRWMYKSIYMFIDMKRAQSSVWK